MLKVEAETLESAYSQAANELSCSITQLDIEIIQTPTSGFLGFFKKQAVIVATIKVEEVAVVQPEKPVAAPEVEKQASVEVKKPVPKVKVKEETTKKAKPAKKSAPKQKKQNSHNDIILPASFVTDQEEDDYDGSDLYADEEEIYVGEETEICDQSHDEIHQQLVKTHIASSSSNSDGKFFASHNEGDASVEPSSVAAEIKEKVENLFKHACFEIDTINVKEHDEKTILIEFSGKDAALLIGKEGYRYKALSYMLYNWINATYHLQLRLEIAEFLKNQEEMIGKYLEAVYENINRDGRAQTKILDGVLVQIALRELRGTYPDKYVAIRSTRDGAKFIIINSFNNN